MARTADQERGRIRQSLDRIWHSRWLLGAGLAAVLLVYAFAGESVSMLALTLAALFIAAAAWPVDQDKASADRAAVIEAGALKSLSGEYLAAAITDPLIVFDNNATIIHANAAATNTFRLATGMSLALKFRAPEVQALIERVLSGEATSGSVETSSKLPVERVYRMSVSAVGHDTALYLMICKDQSEARRIDRMRADFIANASHEMRTPLASIAGFIETLRGPARDDAKAREQFLQIMQDQTRRMSRLIDDLLSLSRLEMKPHLTFEAQVDIAKIIETVIASLTPQATENGVAIERDFSDGSFELAGNRDELFQVFENLLENACKYGRSGGRVVVSIRRSEGAAEPEIIVTVRDFGPGIAEEHIPRVTERFYRIDAETSHARKGTGLGLAIVKHILTRHEARLSIESELGKGAAFTVHLPVR
ncbi:ATP-binding protein [Manganibacter manganicus]|uniref:histidine kinase n=1 Tax=Manganibacter manganicus TaxID=1873176 RepID=A0A1V8RKW2_9HYPH|nr:ATP-binding protein [Pseudaminobacter manganicus]OQM73784.1 two-component sensor histidine kinase [Pseudaminobacter manganicus]